MPRAAKPLTQFRALPGADAIDAEAGIIKGVSVMTIGPALGHGIKIDRKGIEQCLAACQAYGDEGVKLVANHDSGFFEIVGAVKNFRIEGDQLLGDAHLLENAPERPRILEMAAKLPSNFGLSVETTGEHEPVPNSKQKLYRCDDIDAIALVPKPAANKTGIFSEVDIKPKAMEPEEIQKAITEGISAAIAPIEERLSKLESPEKKEGELSEDEKTQEKLSKIVTKAVKEASEDAADKAVTKFAATLGVKNPPKAADAEPKKGNVTKFEAKVEELAKAGTRNPFSVAALKYPALYDEHREQQEGGKR